jgi:DNA-binding CsgD family transcriptional regulator
MINLIVLVVFASTFIADLYFDKQDGIPQSHITHEMALFLLAVGAIIWQIFVIFRKNDRITSLNGELLETKKSYLEWKEKAHASSRHIGQLIDDEFALWHLSQSEKDVALLLIKGLSMKEIADIRATHEKTVRQQATSIYKKSGLSGRQELAAFFLEDILSLPSRPL